MHSITNPIAISSVITYCVLNTVFQPVYSSSDRSGHMQPLGSHAIKHPITELDEFPSPHEFYMNHVYPSVPAIFKNGAKKSPGFMKWNDDYFLNHPEAEDASVEIEMKKVENRSLGVFSTPFTDFMKRYKEEDIYMVSAPPEFLKKDVLFPQSLLCDSVLKRVFDVVMWFSSGGTKSVIHNDDVDNINCLFSGTKEILFMNITKYRNQLVFDHPEKSFFGVDVESVDFDKYPEFEDVEFHQATMSAGDCLYIPYKWIHQVNSIDRNIAVNIWFHHATDILPVHTTCGEHSSDTTLADIEMNAYDDYNLEPFKALLEAIFNNEGVTESSLLQVIKTVDGYGDLHWTNIAIETSKGLFKLVDVNEDQVLNKEDIVALTKDQDRQLFLEQQLIMLKDIQLDQEARRTMEILKKLQNVHKDEL